MNRDRSDLAALRKELERVEMEVRFLRVRADQIELRIASAEPQATPLPSEGRVPTSPYYSEPVPAVPASPTTPEPAPLPPPLPPIIPQENIEQFVQPEPEPEPTPEPEPQYVPEPVAAVASTVESEKPASFELRLGTYWFVRIGIVMLLTAMVFLGNYAYQHIIPLLGPAGKLTLLYAASFGLLAAGTILPRRHERLKNYGQVLFAGGLAAVYFTTYAAHHFPNLKIIQSALLDGFILLAWTSFIVWLADRKKSELLAVFAIGLAYYTALITNVGAFTLVSNLVLATAAVVFLIRNRWVNLSFLSLIASYGTYFYWRYYAASTGIDFDSSKFAIAGYWAIFTAAVFLTRHADFVGPRRAGFLSFNNGAVFALLTASLYGAHTGGFWKLSLISGAILLALAAAARQVIQDDVLPRRAYLAQGLFLITLGLITKYSGPTLGLILAVESGLLLIFSAQWRSRLLQHFSVIIALIAAGSLVTTLQIEDSGAWIKAAGIFGLFLFNAIWSARKIAAPDEPARLQPLTAYFTFLALACWTSAVFTLANPTTVGPILAATCLGLTLSHYLTRAREITYICQGLAILAQFQTLIHTLQFPPQNPTYPILVIIISILLALWWKQQQVLPTEPAVRLPLQLISSFAAAAILYAWLPREYSPNTWIALAAIVTLAWTTFAGFTRSWPLAAAGQIFLIGATLQVFPRLANNHEPPWSILVIPILAYLTLSIVARMLRVREEIANTLRTVSSIYHWVATILTLACVMTYLDAPYRFLALTILFLMSLTASLLGARYTFAPGLFLAIAGLSYWIVELRNFGAEFQNLLALLLLAAAQRVLRKKPGPLGLPEGAHQLWILAISGAIWAYVSRWVIGHSAGAHFYLTASWAALAFLFFLAGFAFRERAYRWAALAVLGSSLGRVILLDVWKLETIYRILSFLALGLVLLALGYIYTRYQEKLAKWL